MKIWDVPTRLFHWTLVSLIAISWLSAEMGRMGMHMVSGQLLIGLIIFRLIYGFIGSQSARFADFVKGPRGTFAYARKLFAAQPSLTPGHNPVGGIAIVLMLSFVLLQASLGLFANDDIFSEGPLAKFISKSLSDTLTGLHEQSFNVLAALIGLHLVAIFFYYVRKNEDLIGPMLSGEKSNLPEGTQPPQMAGSLPAFIAAGLGASVSLALLFLV